MPTKAHSRRVSGFSIFEDFRFKGIARDKEIERRLKRKQKKNATQVPAATRAFHYFLVNGKCYLAGRNRLTWRTDSEMVNAVGSFGFKGTSFIFFGTSEFLVE